MELHICDLYCSLKERLKVEFAIYLCVIIWKRLIFTPQSLLYLSRTGGFAPLSDHQTVPKEIIPHISSILT